MESFFITVENKAKTAIVAIGAWLTVVVIILGQFKKGLLIPHFPGTCVLVHPATH
jgi:uncharacterized membrane protein YdcZ (DUF606 family)